MTAILYDFRHPECRAAVKRAFDGLQALFDASLAALKKTCTVPAVVEPK